MRYCYRKKGEKLVYDLINLFGGGDVGMSYYYKALSRWRYFLRKKDIRDKFDELWFELENEQSLGETMFSCSLARKRKKADEDVDEGQPSPTSVMVLPSEPGYEEFLSKQDGYEGVPV